MSRTARLSSLVCCACLLAAALQAATVADLDAALKATAAYKVGESRKALTAAEAVVRGLRNQPGQRPQIEAKLLALLGSGASADARRWACRELSVVASDASVPPLARLLPDAEMSHMARWALERIPGQQATDALRNALPTTKGEQRVGLINSIARRRDAKAVAPLVALAADQDAKTAAAALTALGRIGTEEALAALAGLRKAAPKALKPVATDAWLLAADQLLAAGKKQAAAAVYKQVYEAPGGEHFRVAAFRGLLAAGDASAWQLIIENLRSDDPTMWPSAARFAREIPGAEATKALAAELRKLPPKAQVLLLGALAARGDAAALPAVTHAAQSKDAEVCVAALRALGAVGDASCIPLLADAAATGAPAVKTVASQSLASLRGADVDAALIAAMKAAAPAVRAVLIEAVGDRRATTAVPALLGAASDADRSVSRAALKALGTLADERVLPALIAMLAAAESSADRSRIEKTLTKVVGNVADRDAAAAPILAVLPKAQGKPRAVLLAVLGKIPTEKALAALRTALNDPDEDAQDAAVRALAAWPDARPMADLLEVARTAKSPVHKVLALRGFVDMAAMPAQRPVADTARLFAEAMTLAQRPDDKKMVLAALAGVHHPDALATALPCCADPALEAEAVAAALSIAKAVRKTHRKEAVAAAEQILETAKAPASKQAAENALIIIGQAMNIAPQGTATSPDGLDKDGGAHGDQAAIDNNPVTYWDEVDNKKLYRLVVTFKQPETINAITILGYQHHGYAPKDFDLLCDGKVVKQVRNAQYSDNVLVVRFGPLACKAVELKITGYYGASPAIRELGIYAPGGTLPKPKTPKK